MTGQDNVRVTYVSQLRMNHRTLLDKLGLYFIPTLHTFSTILKNFHKLPAHQLSQVQNGTLPSLLCNFFCDSLERMLLQRKENASYLALKGKKALTDVIAWMKWVKLSEMSQIIGGQIHHDSISMRCLEWFREESRTVVSGAGRDGGMENCLLGAEY